MFIFLTIFICLFLICAGLILAISGYLNISKGASIPERIYLTFTTFLFAYGLIGFFSPALFCAIGVLDWLPDKFEWPIGYTMSAIPIDNKYYAVLHDPTQRIQIYDKDLNFICGWFPENYKSSVIEPSPANTILAHTRYSRITNEYSINGKLLSRQKDISLDSFDKTENYTDMFIPTNLFLYPYSHPAYSFLIWIIGGILSKPDTRYLGIPKGWSSVEGTPIRLRKFTYPNPIIEKRKIGRSKSGRRH